MERRDGKLTTTMGGTMVKVVMRNFCMFSSIWTKSNFGMMYTGIPRLSAPAIKIVCAIAW
jgi:hypothetical protein